MTVPDAAAYAGSADPHYPQQPRPNRMGSGIYSAV